MDTPTIRVLDFKTKIKPGGRNIDMVLWAPAGGSQYTQVWEVIDQIRPPAERDEDDDRKALKWRFMEHKWAQIEPAYRAWKSGKEMPETGTPLSAWSGVTREEVKLIQLADIRSVEELADAPDNVIERVKLPNKYDLRKQAKLFMDSKDQSAAAQRLADLEAQNATMQQQMTELLAELKAAKEKPKRGRPPKAAEPESEEEAA